MYSSRKSQASTGLSSCAVRATVALSRGGIAKAGPPGPTGPRRRCTAMGRSGAASLLRPRVGQEPLWRRDGRLASSWLGLPLRLWVWLFYSLRPDPTAFTLRADWLKLRSPWRHFDALFAYLGPPAHVLWNIKLPFCTVMLVGGSVCAYSTYSEGISAETSETVMRIFTASSFVIALLLSGRVARAYDRWWTGRTGFGRAQYQLTYLVQQAYTYVPDEATQARASRGPSQGRAAIVRTAVALQWSMVDSIQRFVAPVDPPLQPRSQPHPKVLEHLDPVDAELYTRATQPLFVPLLMILGTLDKVLDNLGLVLRIGFQAPPLALGQLTTGMSDQNGHQAAYWVPALLCLALFAIMLLGVDEAAAQLENGFLLMPLEVYAAARERDVRLHAEYARAMRAGSAAAANGAEEPGGRPRGLRSTVGLFAADMAGGHAAFDHAGESAAGGGHAPDVHSVDAHASLGGITAAMASYVV
eukprot:scaffold12.g8029.t1